VIHYQASPVVVEPSSDPSQPVAISVFLPTGNMELTVEGIDTGGTITISVSSDPLAFAPSTFSLLGFHYQIEAPDVSFASATIRLPYRDEDVAAAGIPEASLRLLHYENNRWKDITTALDTQANIITGVTESFSPFVLGTQEIVDCAISINSGDLFTARLDVQIFSNVAGASQMLIGNDAGFTGAQWQEYRSATTWTISNPGERIVTLLVYARLRDTVGQPMCSGLSLSDDIIYDPLPPTVSIGVQGGTRLGEQQPSTDHPITLVLSAADQEGGSGVTEMQVSTVSDFRGAKWQPFQRKLPMPALPGETIYARVRDGVGNISEPAVVTVNRSFPIFLPMLMR
jgi:hypothetical protein